MKKIILFFLGIFLCSLGLLFSILYLNLLTLGYSFLEYVEFINMKFECLIFYIGLLMIYFSLERNIKNEFLLRNKTKL